MRLLFDENLSPRLVDKLAGEYPGSLHVRSVGLRAKPDVTIWEYARDNDLVIVSKDDDFRQLVFLNGPPPKVIWLSVGNAGTGTICRLLQVKFPILEAFKADPDAGLFPLTPDETA